MGFFSQWRVRRQAPSEGALMRVWILGTAWAIWLFAGVPYAMYALNPAPAKANAAGAETGPPGDLERRLAERGVPVGRPVMIRIFKAESELELWMRNDARFELVAVYPICKWSGSLGPKLTEGDRQSPEGFYSISAAQLHTKGRWPRSLDIGYPNSFDRAHGRTGSYILVHGGCTTVGCYAMTNPVMEEIYALSEAALRNGQDRIPLHIFPFRMTAANLAAHADSQWRDFWADLKAGYDLFERTHLPPSVGVCEKRYVTGEAAAALPQGCIENESQVQPVARNGHRFARSARRLRRAASRVRPRRLAGRNARRAYAAARIARMAAQKRRHAAAFARRPHR